MNVSLRQLEVFMAVAAHRNVTRAAAALGITQPAVTRTIAEVEGEVGLALFERSPRGMALTEAGRVVERRARGIRTELRLAGEELAALRGGKGGRLVFGATPVAAADLVPLAAARLLRSRPDLSVQIIQARRRR